ncbi:Protein MIF2 [Cyberlindnera fabianii]|uniref:Protein MIF2 n=1 Tax=Cyberlindnera fabianii TaxID=36022 RepID=A0A1V2L4F4_CYBFA|nr:Protein MIF2 [Cyberlindnera fabianii]
MDFLEIGVKSRKTGLTARENVKRDAHDMDDIEDFFKDDEPASSDAPVRNSTSIAERSSTRSTRAARSDAEPSRATARKRTPLLSPLPSKGLSRGQATDTDGDDHYDDALDSVPPRSQSAEMEIDEDSRGSIRSVNNFDHNHLTHHTPPRPPRGTTLFLSSDDDSDSDDARDKTFEERQRELERNTTVRSSTRKSTRGNTNSYRDHTPPAFQTSPLLSLSGKLNSPLHTGQMSSRSMASLTKSIASNRRGRNSNLPPPSPDFPIDDGYQSETYSRGGTMGLRERIVDSDDEDDYNDNREDDQDEEEDDDEPFFKPTSKKRGGSRKSTIEESMPPPKKTTVKGPTAKKAPAKVPVRAPVKKSTVSTARKPRAKRSVPVITEYDDSPSGESDAAPEPIEKDNGRKNKFRREEDSKPPSRGRSTVKEHHIDIDTLRKDQESRAPSRPPSSQAPTRRSSRVRVSPLEYWRGERMVYERKPNDSVPSAKEIVTVEQPPEKPISRSSSTVGSRRASRSSSKVRGGSQRTTPARSRNTTRRPRIDIIPEDDEEDDNEDNDELEIAVRNGDAAGSEWMRNGFLKVDAYEGHGSEDKSNRIVAWAAGTENFSTEVKTAEDDFKLAILFDKNREFIASGMMMLPIGGRKNLKSTDGTYFVFYCIKGIIQVTLSGTVFMINKGCSLEVPMGNFYEFTNKGNTEATLFFVQTKGQEIIEWED